MTHCMRFIDRGARLSMVVAMLLFVCTMLLVGTAEAHELRPAIFSVTIEESGNVRLRASINLEAQIAGIGSEHSNTRDSERAPIYDRLRATTPEALRKAFLPLAPGRRSNTRACRPRSSTRSPARWTDQFAKISLTSKCVYRP